MKSSPTASGQTLALLADRFDEPYQQAILSTIEGALQQRSANLMAFAGGIPGSTVRGSDQRSLMFQMVEPGSVDGVILLAGTMVNQLGLDALGALLERTRGVPVCAIGVAVPGVPSVVVDNEAGVNQAMRHLVEHHRVSRFGFVRGPVRNKEAEARYAAFVAALDKAGLALEPEFVWTGDFLRQSGVQAVESWLQSRSSSALPAAFLCANDEMAIGVIQALVRAGVKVPEDTRVVGFDGIDVAKLTNPPLSTVRQPLEDLAMMAVRTVMDQIHGRKAPELQMLETHLVVRESCGCVLQLTSTGQSQLVEESGMPSQPPLPGDFNSAFHRFRQPLQAELARVARGEFSAFAAWDADLISAFSEQVARKNGSFAQTLTQLVSRAAYRGHDVSRFHDVITAFRRFALPCCGEDHMLRTHVENVLQEARSLVAHARERSQAAQALELERFALTLSDVGAALTKTFDLTQLARAVCRELPRLRITAFYLCAYDGPSEGKALPTRSRLIAGFDTELGLVFDGPADETFPTAGVLPEPLQPKVETRQFTVLPLFLEQHSLGYCLIQSRGGKAHVLESLREHLGVALYGARLAARE